MSALRGAARPRSVFFLAFAWYAVAVAVLGFAKTFFWPLATRSGAFEPVVIAHGVFFFAWVAWLLAQATLVRRGQRAAHRMLGWVSVPVAVGMVVTCVAVGLLRARTELAGGPAGGHVDGFVGVVTAMTGFAMLYGAAVWMRRRPDVHKRLVVIATVAVLWPAWFRFRHYAPDVPRPDIVFGLVINDAALIALAVHDRLTLRRVHPVTAWVGGALVVDHLIETALFGGPLWSSWSRALIALLP